MEGGVAGTWGQVCQREGPGAGCSCSHGMGDGGDKIPVFLS